MESEDHTSERYRRCANGDVAEPQQVLVVGQRIATGVALVTVVDTSNERVYYPSVLFVCSKTIFKFPASGTNR
jgi:hypothetical protein